MTRVFFNVKKACLNGNCKKEIFFKQFDQQSLFVISLLVWHSFRSAKNLFKNIGIGMPMVEIIEIF